MPARARAILDCHRALLLPLPLLSFDSQETHLLVLHRGPLRAHQALQFTLPLQLRKELLASPTGAPVPDPRVTRRGSLRSDGKVDVVHR